MMKAQILRGSKQEIAESLVRISGEVREAIVFVEEPAPSVVGDGSSADAEDMFAEMRPFMVDVPTFDDSRQAIYTRQAGE